MSFHLSCASRPSSSQSLTDRPTKISTDDGTAANEHNKYRYQLIVETGHSDGTHLLLVQLEPLPILPILLGRRGGGGRTESTGTRGCARVGICRIVIIRGRLARGRRRRRRRSVGAAARTTMVVVLSLSVHRSGQARTASVDFLWCGWLLLWIIWNTYRLGPLRSPPTQNEVPRLSRRQILVGDV